MKKLISKTIIGKEFMHSRVDSFFVRNHAEAIRDALNKMGYELNPGETWHIYDYDYSQNAYVDRELYVHKGKVKVRTVYLT